MRCSMCCGRIGSTSSLSSSAAHLRKVRFVLTQTCAKLIGVNNRDLRTLEVSLETSLSLAREAPVDVLLISESGLRSPDDLQCLRAAGYHGFLIGETLMRADDPEEALRNLL